MMPKSTATSLPSSSTNRLPGCMSAWKKPSRSAWRRKLWITLRPSSGRSSPARSSARAIVQRDAVDPFQRQHVRARCGPSRPSARGSRDRPWCSPPSRRARRLRAANPSRSRPSAPACRRPRSRRSRRASSDEALRPCARRSRNASRSRLETRIDVGPQHLHRDGLRRTPSSSISARCTCAIDAAATGGPKLAKTLRHRLLEARWRSRASASLCGNGGMRSCRLSRSRATPRRRRRRAASPETGRA